MFKQSIVKIFTSQVGVTSCGSDSEDTTGNIEEGDVESATTQIENQNILLGL